MRIDVLTLFPNMFQGPFDESIIKRAQEKGLVDIHIHNFRDWATNKHKSVDDTPYGGGAGMVLRVDVLVTALESILGRTLPFKKPHEAIYLLSPKGVTFTQQTARSIAQIDRITLIAGHYEDVDARINEFIDGQISVGDYVLTGGELPAMVVVDAVTRLLPGVITQSSTEEESFSEPETLEYPHYTKPLIFRGLAVPDILRSGNHRAIATWRQSQKKRKSELF